MARPTAAQLSQLQSKTLIALLGTLKGWISWSSRQMAQASSLRERDDFRYLDYSHTHDGSYCRHTLSTRLPTWDGGEHNVHHHGLLVPPKLDRGIPIQLE